MSETNFWDKARPVLQMLGLDPIRVENVIHRGFPDVSYADGLIETKWLPAWPARAATPVQVEYKPGQTAVLSRRWLAGGLAWTLLQVAEEWLLFDGWTSIEVSRGCTRQRLYELAIWRTTRSPGAGDVARLGLFLKGNAEAMMPHDRAKWHRLKAHQSLEDVSKEIGWPEFLIAEAEKGSDQTDDLLAAWES